MKLDDNTIKAIDSILDSRSAMGTLGEHEVYRVLEAIGVHTPQYHFTDLQNPEQVTLNWPGDFVVKLVADNLAHKTGLNAIKIGVQASDIGEVAQHMLVTFPEAYAAYLTDNPEKLPSDYKSSYDTVSGMSATRIAEDIRGVLVTELIQHDTNFGGEFQVGIKHDPAFGPMLIYGVGGANGDAFLGNLAVKDQVMAMASLGMLGEKPSERFNELIKQAGLFYDSLSGMRRGDDSADHTQGIIETLQKIASLGWSYSSLNHEARYHMNFEVNPFTVGKGTVALDGLVSFWEAQNTRTAERPYHKIERALNPSSVLFAGLSTSNPRTSGENVLNKLVASGFDPDQIYFCTQKPEELRTAINERFKKKYSVEFGSDRFFVKAADMAREHPNIQVDMVYNAAPPAAVPQIINEVLDSGIAHTIYTITAGFGETKAGKEAEEDMARRISESSTILLGFNTLGNYYVGKERTIDTFFAPPEYLSSSREDNVLSNVALVSQSGARALTVRSGLGNSVSFPLTMSIGNCTDMKPSHYLRWLDERDETFDVYAFYIESFADGDGLKFAQRARSMVRDGKTILVHKAGKSPEAASATASHTGKAAGSYDIAESTLREAGVYVTNNLQDFERMIHMSAAFHSIPIGLNFDNVRTGAVSNAGYEKCAIADHVINERTGENYLRLPIISPQTLERIRGALDLAKVNFIDQSRYPGDLSPLAPDTRFYELVGLAKKDPAKFSVGAYNEVMRAIMEDNSIDAAVLSVVAETPALNTLPPEQHHPHDMTADGSLIQEMISISQDYSGIKPVVFSIAAGYKHDPAAQFLERAGAVVYRYPDQATDMLGKYLNHRKLEVMVREG